MARLCLAAALVSLFAAPAARAELPPEDLASPVHSIHARDLAAHRALPKPVRTWAPRAVLREGRVKSVSRTVYGYLPFWVQDTTAIRWRALTHLAWFSVEMNASGDIDAWHGWPDTETVEAAHEAGVRVDLTFTLFSGTGIRALVTSPTARQNAIGNMIDAMEAGGADGISIDFEGVIDGSREGLVQFVAELRQALDDRGHGDAEITLAGPSVDWNDEWDLPALLEHADYFFIMAYAYFYGGSSHAGPTGILRISDDWSSATSWSALRSIARYASMVTPERRRKIVYGVPYYGEEWTTTSGAMGASTVAHVGAVTYAGARSDLAAGRTRLWDDGSKTPWYAWQSGGAWHQVYYDDEESLSLKYQLALDEDLGGVGMWALNYDSGHEELWDLLERALAVPGAPPVGHRDNPVVVAATPFHDERDTTVGPSQYFNAYACAPDTPEYGKEWVYRIDVCQPGRLSARVTSEPGVDPDVHLLADAAESACLARDNLEASADVEPGRLYVVVDTYVANKVELEGPFALDVDFVPEPGSDGCRPDEVCDAGACVCQNGGVTCDGACVDTSTDPEHCGACGKACPEGKTCARGACEGGGEPTPTPPPPEEEGCSCRAASAGGTPHAWIALLALAGAAWVRRARRTSPACSPVI
jgi:MYXO-CTERM domain-containing protein